MSPVSRGRRPAKSRWSGTRVVRPAVSVVPDVCECPGCSGADVDPDDFIDSLVGDAADLLKAADPLDAELFGAAFMAAGDVAGDGLSTTPTVVRRPTSCSYPAKTSTNPST